MSDTPKDRSALRSGDGLTTAEEAREILSRFNASHFRMRNREHARYSIPADHRRDDDLRMSAFIDRAERVEAENAALLEIIESAAWHICGTRRVDHNYNGQVAGTLVTDSGALSIGAELLRTLAESGRFRIVAECGRMVVGYWPQNDPAKKETNHAATE